MNIVVAISVLLMVLGLTVLLARPGSRKCPEGSGLYPECLYVVSVDGNCVRVVHPDKTVTFVVIRDLSEIVIETNDSGPLGTDVFYHLNTADPAASCSFPLGATGENRVMARLAGLPGYDKGAHTQAMRSTSNKQFVVWRTTA